MPKEILFEDGMRARLLSGVNKAADAVKSTLGPVGRNVTLHKKAELRDSQWSDNSTPFSKPVVINDGATLVSALALADPVEDLGARLLREACTKTNDCAGDGTTTAAILTQALLAGGYRLISAGYNPVPLRRGLQMAVEHTLQELETMAQPVDTEEKAARVAAVSCGEDALGRLIGRAVYSVGPEGVVLVDDTAPTFDDRLELKQGIVLDKGFVHEGMAEDTAHITSHLQDAYVLITDYKIEQVADILDLLIEVAETDRPLLIIAEELSADVVAFILQNKAEGDLVINAVHPPLYGEGRSWKLDDLAVQTGAAFISRSAGRSLRDTRLADLGTAGSVKISRRETVIQNPGGDEEAVLRREQELRHLVASTDYDFNRQRFRERLATFVSGIATLVPGGRSEIEIFERKLRVEDAVHATRRAMERGVVPGGGTALIDCLPALRALAAGTTGEEKYGVELLAGALSRPLWQIAENAGFSGDAVVEKVCSAPPGTGLDARTGTCGPMAAMGILDPLSVTEEALRNAASVSAALLTCGAAVTDTNPPPKGGTTP